MNTVKYVLIFLALLSCTASAHEVSGRSVTVSGEAAAIVSPDHVEWNLRIMVRSEVQEELGLQAGDILSQLKAVAKRLGHEDDGIIYGKVTIWMRYKQENNRETEEFSHYELMQPMTVIQTDMSLYEEYWRELTAIDGLQVNQNFVATTVEDTRRLLRIEALEAAQQKAEDLAAVVGSKVGAAISISEFKPSPEGSYSNNVAYMVEVPSSVGKPKGVHVLVKLYAEFELE
jgi:hypothetical protein